MESERKTIVLVEDQEILARLIEHKLEQCGYAVKVAFDGAEGLRLIRSVKPALVLLDMGLPRIDGFGVLEELHATHLLPDLPVIIISNTGEPIEIDRAHKLGVRDYLIKVNFAPDELVAKVEQLFRALPPPQAEPSEARAPHILIVDDEALFVELLEQKFKLAGFLVRRAATTEQARAVLAEEPADIMLLDVRLPGEDGIALLRDIREREGHAPGHRLPILIISNLSQQTEIAKAREAGADDYIVKAHVDLSDIVERVRSVLSAVT